MNWHGVITVGTEQRGQGDLPDLLQLLRAELDGRVVRLVPESVALSEPTKLFPDDAAESLADDGGDFPGAAGDHRRLRKASREQINVGHIPEIKNVYEGNDLIRAFFVSSRNAIFKRSSVR